VGGGTVGTGTVFRLEPPPSGQDNWTYTVLYSFAGSGDGAFPHANLIFDRTGALYGTTSEGGEFFGGTVFKLTPTTTPPWEETLLWSFGSGSDGNAPDGPLKFERGVLYGTTAGGGTYGEGTVFEVNPECLHLQ
jgi:uncharacterized repeat protein (TIGR03803 family)